MKFLNSGFKRSPNLELSLITFSMVLICNFANTQMQNCIFDVKVKRINFQVKLVYFIQIFIFFVAFQQMGYRFTPTFVQNLLAKYDPRTRRLTLDNFIVACVQIQRLTTSFRNRDREMRGQATLAYEDFVGLALGAHN